MWNKEQRRDCRYPCRDEVVVTLESLLTRRRVSAKMVNLSLSGCLVRPDERGVLREDEVTNVSFYMSGRGVRLMGRVRNIREDGAAMGIEFRGRDDGWKSTIAKLVTELAEHQTFGPR